MKALALAASRVSSSISPSLHALESLPQFQESIYQFKSNPKGNPVDHQYFSKILSRNDWFLLLNHEFKAKRIILNPQFVISILQNQEDPLYPFKFYMWVLNVDPLFAKDQSVRGVLANCLHRKGPLVLSVDLLRDIKNSGYRINEELLCVLIGSWGRLGLAKYCDEIFGQISFLGISPSTRLYNAVIDALVKSNSLDLAYLKFQQMSADNCKADRFTYNILIHGVCRSGVVDEALRLVKQMEGLGHTPNVFTYTMLIDGFFNAKKVDEAFSVLDKMKARKVSPNEATVRSFIHGVFRCVAPDKAFEIAIKFIERQHVLQKLACDTLLCCLSSNNMAREAGALLKKFGKLGYMPDNAAFNIAVNCLIKGLDLNDTCNILGEFVEQGSKLVFRTYLTLIEALNMAGKITEGDRYFNQMVKDGFLSSVCSYNMVIDCFCKTRMMDKAAKAFKEMEYKGIIPNLVTFNTLISGYCKEGEVRKSRDLLEMLLEHRFKPDIFTFSSIIDGLCRAKQIEDAFSCFTEMVEWGISPNAVTYNTLIRSLCIIGDIPRAMKLSRKMQMDGISPDVFTFNALIQGFCIMGKAENAEKLLSSMLSLGLVPDNYTYGAFIKVFCESGRFNEAKEIFLSMEANGCLPDSFTCKIILDALVKQGQLEEAKKLAKKCSERGIFVNVSTGQEDSALPDS
ncbi:putative pentatricopeptide repeat-containing protein At3g16890, mitochondrial [Mercurialis annua]|uniref:putative pentatricopeptide repeat-containing protein At3g16890, mitochondrial n=1 Tax=Mercurialis annua TaxID=3986 RepID=UPI00215FB5EE|nr:putative pentatricopeptide repeat-containing protein At3g16890, mitochondrial [Mercurialis annua]XP_050224647.1 putative pentatricopeptide repeat-containing protein At3g16890, mitochondrial [Mercurialis annua]